FLERASWLCWLIILRHLGDLGRKESLSSQQRTLSSLETGVVLFQDPRLVARGEHSSCCLWWEGHLFGCFVFHRFIVGSHVNISAFSPSLIYFSSRAHTDTET
ncbi:hypothetical protein, partial [Ferrithrix thermotolerans]|uniref:hypothetical protein n=1 Tax=Ferrithrix thermotolerans TaxID=209649 RepID=UPI001C49F65E